MKINKKEKIKSSFKISLSEEEAMILVRFLGGTSIDTVETGGQFKTRDDEEEANNLLYSLYAELKNATGYAFWED